MANSTAIYQLQEKVKILAEVLFEAKQIDSPSTKSLAQFSEINYETLRSSARSWRVSNSIAKKLSMAGNFSLGNTYWVDLEISEAQRLKAIPEGDYEGEYTPKNFRKFLRSQWNLTKHKNLKLRSRIPVKNEEATISFSFSDSGQSMSQESSMDIFFELDGVARYYEGKFKYGFNKIQIELQARNSREIFFEDRCGAGEPFDIGGGKLSARGTKFEPRWNFFVDGGVIDGSFVTSEAPICRLINKDVGDIIDGKVSAQLYDGVLVRKDGKKLSSAAKAAIIKILISKTINPEASKSGCLDLGRQELEIVQELSDE